MKTGFILFFNLKIRFGRTESLQQFKFVLQNHETFESTIFRSDGFYQYLIPMGFFVKD